MTWNELIDKKTFDKEVVSFTFSLISTALGFFTALYFNNRVEHRKEIESFNNIKKSIKAELRQNQNVIDKSFKKYFEGVIYNELNTSISNQHLSSNIVMKYATPELLIAIQNYVRTCELCNKQKNELKEFRINDSENKWVNALENSLKTSIVNTLSTIKEVEIELSDTTKK